MGERGSAIFLGDFARAVGELRLIDPAAIALVAEMLGFSPHAGDKAVAARRAGTHSGAEGGGPARDWAGGEFGEEESRARDARWGQEEEEPVRRSIPIELVPTPGEKESWVPQAEPPTQEQLDEGTTEQPPLLPLFRPEWTRGILVAALATEATDGPLDVDRIAELLAAHEGLSHLPTLPSWTLNRGLQLLLDKSHAMMPFMRDQAWLLREILNVVGPDRAQVLRFAGSPARGAGVGRRPWPRYEPPPPATPVVLLTDLGISQPPLAADWAAEDEWARFAELVRRSGCPLLALVPHKPERWPRRLAQLMTVVRWDRATTAATVTRQLRRR